MGEKICGAHIGETSEPGVRVCVSECVSMGPGCVRSMEMFCITGYV